MSDLHEEFEAMREADKGTDGVGASDRLAALQQLANEVLHFPPDAQPGAFQDAALRFAEGIQALTRTAPTRLRGVAASGGGAPMSEQHRAANEESFKQNGLDWCAHQMAFYWPRNEFGSLLTEDEVAQLRADAGSAVSGRAPAPDALRAALEPFVALVAWLDGVFPADRYPDSALIPTVVGANLTMGDLRRLQAALAQAPRAPAPSEAEPSEPQ